MLLMMVVMMGGHHMSGGHSTSGRDVDGHNAVLDTLGQRFAGGELTRDEFEERKKVLSA